MKLKKLLKNIPIKIIKGSKEMEISGVCANSKLVSPGNLFIAKKGKTDDGSLYIPEAIASGATAVLTDIYDPSFKEITQIIHPNANAIESLIASQYYQFPSQELFIVGITGTNGKTTTSFLIKHLLDNLFGPCGLIGTIEYIIGQHRYLATRTTPDVSTNHKMLREMIIQGCQNAVMEVTSHALDQGRVSGIEYDVAVFTNLTLDHLDYHQTMENYATAKSKLFSSLNSQKKKKNPFPKVAIVNVDNPWYTQMIKDCQTAILTYGIGSPSDLMATDIELFSDKTRFTIAYKKERISLTWPLIGRFNVYNCLAAVGVGLSRGAPLAKIVKIMESAPPAPGRLELVPNPLGLKIYVDFAHTDDALINVLQCLSELKKNGKIITVFGCGGDRDPFKRPKMAQAAQDYSDEIIVTSDNPRTEEPTEIARQIAKGFSQKKKYHIEIDRKKAIAQAIDLATQDDIILIAGKGHETYQIFAHKTVEFDDRKIAIQLCQQKALRVK